VFLILLAAFVAAAAGVGAYFYGKGTGEDLDAARAHGRVVGKRAGAAKGTKVGYAEGFKKGRERGYSQTYADAYRKAYGQAFEDASLAVPEKIKVPDQ
jgi:hypothetical protein